MSSEEILDGTPKLEQSSTPSLNRTPRNLLRVVAGLQLLFGGFLIYTFVDQITRILLNPESALFLQNHNFSTIFLIRICLLFLVALCLLAGSIGLFNRAKYGWIFSLGVSVFFILFPILFFVGQLLTPSGMNDRIEWIPLAIMVFFGLIAILLLLNPVRNYFRPNVKNYIVVGTIALLLSLSYIALPLYRSIMIN